MTIDIMKEAIEASKDLTKDYADVITYVNHDSSETVANSDRKIDLLYLDSADEPAISLAECISAYPHLTDDTIVYIDDSSISHKRVGGTCKGVLVYQYLYEKGWDIVFDDGVQIIMRKNKKAQESGRSALSKMLVRMKVKKIYKRFHRKLRQRTYDTIERS